MPAPNAKAYKSLKERAAKKLSKVTAPGESAPSAPSEIIVKKTFAESLAAGATSITSFANDFLDVQFYTKQAEVMDNSLDATEVTFVAANRTGKSFSAAVWCIHRAFYQHLSPYMRPEKLSWKNTYKIFTTSLSQDQANIVFNYIRSFVENVKMQRFVEDLVMSPFPELTLRTKASGEWRVSKIGARSLAKKGVHILGHSLAGVLVDECAFVPDYEYIEEMVLRMRMAEWGGTLFRISSPAGKSNHLYRFFLKGWDPHRPNQINEKDPRYYSAKLSTYDNPYISKAFLREQEQRMDPLMYQQNVLGEFVDSFDYFSMLVIQGMYEDAEWSLPEERKPGRVYVLGADLAALRDATVVFVLDVTEPHSWRVVYVGEIRQASWPSVREFVKGVWGMYSPVVSTLDATGVGAPIVDQLRDEDGIPGIDAFVFSSSSKPDLLTRLQDAAQRKKIKFPFGPATRRLIDELSVYKLEDKGLSTDYVMALALAHRAGELYHRKNYVDTTIYDDLAVVPVGFGGRAVPNDLILSRDEEYEGGLKFRIDPETGIFLPAGIDLDDFNILF